MPQIPARCVAATRVLLFIELEWAAARSTPSASCRCIRAVRTADELSNPGRFFEPPRKRPFHWTGEGPIARWRMLDVILDSGIVAVAYYAHISRRGQRSVRNEMLPRASRWAADEGVEHLVIEASDDVTMSRDQHTLLDTFRESGGVPFGYDWRSKSEPLLWIADAVAGAVGEFVIGKDDQWFNRLSAAGAIHLKQHP